MKLLINNKEIVYFLLSKLDYKQRIKDNVEYSTPLTDKTIAWIEKRLRKKNLVDDILKIKIKERLQKSIHRDLKNYIETIVDFLKIEKEKDYELVHSQFEYVIEALGEDFILDQYLNSDQTGFVKSFGLHIDSTSTLIRRKRFESYQDDCLIRNTVGNEELLVTKIDQKYPFWFIDSGYTNFLEPNKKWHRIVRNHLHHGKYFDAPADRLDNFVSFPKPWRHEGEYIYVIEPGPFAASIFHADLKTWKYEVEKEIRKHSDKPIKFREKAPKKERTSLYKELLDDDFYCIISINSNAATEAIWAGVPAITLDIHVSNAVTRSQISQINDLYRENLGAWLCMLSYSQYTYRELIDGTAYRNFLKYHG